MPSADPDEEKEPATVATRTLLKLKEVKAVGVVLG
jgi:RPA family protein